MADIKKTVSSAIGEEYVSVVGCGIERYQSEYKDSELSEDEIINLAVNGRDFFEKHKETIFRTDSSRYPIGARREIVSMFLAGKDISQFIPTPSQMQEELSAEAEKLYEEMREYRSKLVSKKRDLPDNEAALYEDLLGALGSVNLKDSLQRSKGVIKGFGGNLYAKLREEINPENLELISFYLAAIFWEAFLNGVVLEDGYPSKLVSKYSRPTIENSQKNVTQALLLPRVSFMALKEKYEEHASELGILKREIENYANTASVKAKESVETFNNTDANLKDYIKQAAELKGDLGFLVLSRAFTSFIKTKEKDIKYHLRYLKFMGALLLLIPLLAFAYFQIYPQNANTVSIPVVQGAYSTAKIKPVNATKATVVAEQNKKPIATDSSPWLGIVNRLLNYLPLAVIELFLLFYFKILLSNYNSAQAQLLQLRMRKSVCQFIQDYISFKKQNEVGDLEKFDSLIFGNLMPNAEQIPSTFEGLDHLGKIIGEFKPK
jgi:hypothetical protein